MMLNGHAKATRWGIVGALSLGLLMSCGGADTGSDGGTADTIEPGTDFAGLIDFPDFVSLTSEEVQKILAQAVNEAAAQGKPATIAIVDRVGNVLAVFEMRGATRNLSAIAEVPRFIGQGPLSGTTLVGADGSGLDGLNIPGLGGDGLIVGNAQASAAAIGAIAKAITGAYLSSSGNAFTTRTASQIVQENFNPEETFQPGGPLFGVQFSQLPCSDLATRFTPGQGVGAGPHRSPLGLSADPGGLPIYKDGFVVGGIGVISDGVYGLDLSLTDTDSAAEMQDELIALAGITDFEAPEAIRAYRITVEGNTLRYTDDNDGDRDRLVGDPATAPDFATVLTMGQLFPVTGYYEVNTGDAADVLAGTAYGQTASGYVPATSLNGGSPFTNPNAFVLVDDNGNPRFSPKAAGDTPGGSAANALTREEVIAMIDSALGVALAGRAQIRRPLNSRIQVTVSVVDTNGEVLGVARTPDGPIFGTDVSLQKARTAMFFSSAGAGDELDAVAGATVQVPDPLNGGALQDVTLPPLSDYVTAARAFVAPDALTGLNAFSDRGNGNLSRPFYPDGVQKTQGGDDSPNGPFSRPFNSPDTTQNWSPFSTGLQFDLIGGNILEHVFFILGLGDDTDIGCTGLNPRSVAFPEAPLANGAQIFAGSVPVYRNGILVGGLGVSGDGIDQDDMISSLGLRRGGLRTDGGIGHAPEAIRSDTIIPIQGNGNRLRYVSCPFSPFIESDIQNACETL